MPISRIPPARGVRAKNKNATNTTPFKLIHTQYTPTQVEYDDPFDSDLYAVGVELAAGFRALRLQRQAAGRDHWSCQSTLHGLARKPAPQHGSPQHGGGESVGGASHSAPHAAPQHGISDKRSGEAAVLPPAEAQQSSSGAPQPHEWWRTHQKQARRQPAEA